MSAEFNNTLEDMFALFSSTGEHENADCFERVMASRFNSADFSRADLLFDVRTGLSNLIYQESNKNLTSWSKPNPQSIASILAKVKVCEKYGIAKDMIQVLLVESCGFSGEEARKADEALVFKAFMQPLERMTRREKTSPTVLERVKVNLIRNTPLEAIKKNNIDDETMLFYLLTKRKDIISILPSHYKKQVIENDLGM